MIHVHCSMSAWRNVDVMMLLEMKIIQYLRFDTTKIIQMNYVMNPAKSCGFWFCLHSPSHMACYQPTSKLQAIPSPPPAVLQESIEPTNEQMHAEFHMFCLQIPSHSMLSTELLEIWSHVVSSQNGPKSLHLMLYNSKDNSHISALTKILIPSSHRNCIHDSHYITSNLFFEPSEIKH